jgi:uncharacterized membrane protein YdbT with pleckstrin-like domain
MAATRDEAWSPREHETILAETQPYIRTRLRWYLYLAIPTLGITAVMYLYYRLRFHLTKPRWTLTNQRIVRSGGWLSRRATSVSVEKIQEVNYGRNFWDRKLFGTGSIWVETAATQGTTVFAPVKHDDPFREAVDAVMQPSAKPTRSDATSA